MVKLASIISMNRKHVAAKISYTGKGKYAIEEARNMVRLDDPNITMIIGVTMLYQTQLTTLDVVVLLELADSDFSSIIKPSSSPLTIHNIKHFSIQIASALKYLHKEKKMRHLDLKPGNILYDHTQERFNIIDFGHTRPFIQFNPYVAHFSYPPETYMTNPFVYNTVRGFTQAEFEEYLGIKPFKVTKDFMKSYDFFIDYAFPANCILNGYKPEFGFKDKKDILKFIRVETYKDHTHEEIKKRCLMTNDIYGLGLSLM